VIFDFRFLILDWNLEAALLLPPGRVTIQSKIKNLKSKLSLSRSLMVFF
jgi:hypothetical protein